MHRWNVHGKLGHSIHPHNLLPQLPPHPAIPSPFYLNIINLFKIIIFTLQIEQNVVYIQCNDRTNLSRIQ
jgi:hypothetical protein